MTLGLFGDFAAGGATGNAVPMSEGQPKAFKEVRVKKQTLDHWMKETNLLSLDFMKIDIEGHEDCFIEGAKETIKRFRPLILGEFSEGHMTYKGVDVDLFYQKFSLDFDYLAFTLKEGQCVPTKTLKGRKNAEDILLVPRERNLT
jgi:hypothetical protein